jgi:hypothetical protein
MPCWWRSATSMPIPLPSSAASTEPADVPMQTSTSRASKPASASSAWTAAIIQASPSTPPAPSTSPRRTPSPSAALT